MKTNRLISIVMMLLEKERVSATELANIFKVSTRTIYRDMDDINLAGIPIVAIPGVNGGISMDEHFRAEKSQFTAADVKELLMCLNDGEPTANIAEVVQVVEQLESSLASKEASELAVADEADEPKEQIKQVQHVQQIQQAEHIEPPRYKPQQRGDNLLLHIQIIKAALIEHRTILFESVDTRGKASSQEIEPVRLLHKGNGWFIQGFCGLRNEVRTFRLSRIFDLKLTNTTFTPRSISREEFTAGMSSEVAEIDVVIHFHESIKNYVLSVFGEMEITSKLGDYYTCVISIQDNEQGYKNLLLCGALCECIEPPHVRKYIADTAMAIAKLYK